MHRLGIILLSAVVAFGALRQSISAQTPPDKITLGTITLSLNNLPIYVAQDKGFFAKENLFVEAVVLNASTRAIPALIGGSTQISASSAMTTIRAVEKGANLKIVGGLINAPVYDLYAPAKYKSIKELKGATIGVTGLITSDTVLMKEMLKANGLEYPRDYAMLAIGGTPERWLAMQTGNVAAGILSPPYTFVADEAGFINLGSTAKYTPNFTQTVFNVRAEWAQEKKPCWFAFSARRCARRIGFIRRKKTPCASSPSDLNSAKNIRKPHGAISFRTTPFPKTAKSTPKAWTKSCNCSSRTAPCGRRCPKPISTWT